jgi:hypothetical protein
VTRSYRHVSWLSIQLVHVRRLHPTAQLHFSNHVLRPCDDETLKAVMELGGVNHCSLHCRLAKFRGLMIMGKYGAGIGLKYPIAWKFILGTYKKSRFLTNHIAVFPHNHQTTECRQTTV